MGFLEKQGSSILTIDFNHYTPKLFVFSCGLKFGVDRQYRTPKIDAAIFVL